MNTILYIDEEESEAITFKIKMEQLKAFNVEYMLVSDGLDIGELLAEINQRQFKCLIVDYFLKQGSKVGYQGDTVAQAFAEKHPHFPLLVLSNKDDDAIQTSSNIDVTKIRSKQLYARESEKFITLVNKMVNEYNDLQSSKAEELEDLRVREIRGELKAGEEERLALLDAEIDGELDASNTIPIALKSSTNTERLDELIKRADEIISRMDSIS